MYIESLNLVKMPRARESRFAVLSELKNLSQEADRHIDEFPVESAIDAWFSAVKEKFILIRDCTSVQVFEYPPESSSIFGQDRTNRIVKPDVPEAQVGHIHLDKNRSASKENEAVAGKENKTVVESEIINNATPQRNAEIKVSVAKDKVPEKPTLLVSSSRKITPETTSCFPCTPKLKIHIPFKKSVLQSGSNNSVERLRTPLAEKTFNKTLDRTVILDSGKSVKNSDSCKIVSAVNNSSGVKLRSSLKRKSSLNEGGSNKKQKTNVLKDIPTSSSISASKTTRPKYAVEKAVRVKAITTLSAENKKKLSAVIVPTIKLKQTPVQQLKEQQVLEEIKKREEKANENRKRVLAERQMKAEETKKKREEKNEKTKQNRLKIEKEKEKNVMETVKSQAAKEVVKKTGMKTRVKELIDQSLKESKSGPLTSSKQNEANNEGFKTPNPKTSTDGENFVNYDLTPIPDSSTYDFSDSEDDKRPRKPIPLWAQGCYLKSALLAQHFNPPNPDEIFGRVIDNPDLAEIFKIQKKRYKIRTSSAVWNTPPDRCLRY